MATYLQNSIEKTEGGGVLLGKAFEQSGNIIIDMVTTPQVNDIRRRFFFFRNQKRHQQIINEIWKESEGTINYLGEWHTHPEDVPIPSLIDLQNWRKQVHNASYEGDCLIFIILGTKAFKVFEVFRNDLRIHSLSIKK